MNEQIQNQTYDVNTKLMHAENDLMEQNVKEERAAKAIAELQDALEAARSDRRDIDMELIAVKKNYLQTKQELDQEKLKNENVNVELINLVNENNALQRDMQAELKVNGEVTQSRQYLEMRNERMDKDLQEAREGIIELQAENNRLKMQIQQIELSREKGDVDLGNRKLELERQFLEVNNQRAIEID